MEDQVSSMVKASYVRHSVPVNPKDLIQLLIIPLLKKAIHDFADTAERSAWLVIQSKVMLRVILNRVGDQAKQILEEEQEGFRSRRRATEQILNLSLLTGKYL